MNINPINQTNSTNFNGKVITRGNWPQHLAEEFKSHHVFKNIENLDFNIIGTMMTKKATKTTPRHIEGQNLYKIILSAEKDAPSAAEQIANLRTNLGRRLELSEHFHSDESTSKMMLTRIKPESLKNGLDIVV